MTKIASVLFAATLCSLVFVGGLADCAKQAPPSETSPAASTQPPGAEIAASPQASESPETQVQATPTGPVDLLSAQQGTILRSWPATSLNTSPATLLGQGGWVAKEGSSGPYDVVYELAGPATIQEFVYYAGGDQRSDAQTVHFAVSSTSATSGFSDVGTYQLNGNGRLDFPVTPPARGRWIKMTIDQRGASTQLHALSAMGTLAARPAAGPVAGVWKFIQGSPYASVGVANGAAGVFPDSLDARQLTPDDSVLDVRQAGTELSAGVCATHSETAYHGDEVGTIVSLSGGPPQLVPAVVNPEGTMMIGYANASGVDWFAVRLTGATSCDSVYAQGAPHGSGTPVLELFDNNPDAYPPYRLTSAFPGYRIVPLLVTLLDPKVLGNYQTAVLSRACNAASLLSKSSAQALTDWVYSGNKLIIHDADDCTATDYSFLPYPFTTSNPGAHAARGSNLILVESNTLGSDSTDRSHFVDVKAYLGTVGQQLGDANVVTTQDRHWCGHLYGTNVLNQNGFVQMFAPFGQGMIIYDGLDGDDGDIPQYQKVALLELQQPPGAALPCGQLVSTPFTIAPSSEEKFTPGKSQTTTFPLVVFASHGFSGTVNLAVQPPAGAQWSTALSRSQVSLSGGTSPFNLTLTVPQDARPGSYPFTVKGTDAAGDRASATVTLFSSGAHAAAPPMRTPSVPQTPRIAIALATAKRVALYGIYFDFASAKLKPESTPVIAEIASVLRANPAWKLTIEGHTDNVGGADYNLDLSKRRAASVKDALVTRYHIAANRLSTVGYGFSRPKATNDTPQGRALNRRVELVRR